ncbi:hypothetical protein D9M71_435790 [compost metagenome]
MGCRQHPYIDVDRLAAADPFNVFFLEETQQVGLQFQWQVTNLVKKQGAAVGSLDTAYFALVRPGKRAFFMTEQLGLYQVLRNRPTVDRYKGFVMALRLAVQGSRHQFLACATLATNQHRRLGGRQFAEQFAQFANRSAVTQQLVRKFSCMNVALATQARHTEGPANGDLHPRDIERQGMEIEKPFADKVTDILHAQLFGTEHRNPFGIAAADEVFHRIRALQVHGLQAKQADITRMFRGRRQGTTVNVPADIAQARQQTVTIIARIDDQQAAVGCRFKHDLSLAPIVGNLCRNSKLAGPSVTVATMRQTPTTVCPQSVKTWARQGISLNFQRLTRHLSALFLHSIKKTSKYV